MIERPEDQRLRLGTHAPAAITSTYEIRNFTVQTDQYGGFYVPWTAPVFEGSTEPLPQEIVTTESFARLPNGYLSFVWVFELFTADMYKYWLTTFYSSGATWYADVSGMTYDEGYTAVYFTARMWRPERLDHVPGGYGNVPFTFMRVKVIT